MPNDLSHLAPWLAQVRVAPGGESPILLPVGDGKSAGAMISPRRGVGSNLLQTAGAAPLVLMVLAAHEYRENGGVMPAWCST